MGRINRRVMMIGGAITMPNMPPDWTWRQMATEVFWQVLQENGVKVADVDLVTCAYNDRTIIDSSIGPQVADALGIVPKPVIVTASACAGNGIASFNAWNAIASGRCDVVVSLGFARSDNPFSWLFNLESLPANPPDPSPLSQSKTGEREDIPHSAFRIYLARPDGRYPAI